MAVNGTNTIERLTDLEAQGREHTARLIGIENSFSQLKGDVRVLSEDVKNLISAVTRQEAQPRFDLPKIMPVIASAIVIFAAMASGIIYVSGNTTKPETLENRLRLDFLQERIDNGWTTPNTTVITKQRRGY